jgi:hypothetical protein
MHERKKKSKMVPCRLDGYHQETWILNTRKCVYLFKDQKKMESRWYTLVHGTKMADEQRQPWLSRGHLTGQVMT